LQRYRPDVVLAASVAELAALAALIATVSLPAFVVLVVLSLVVVAVSSTNRHQVLAFTGHGNVALAASRKGWPEAAAGPVERDLALPEPVGLGVPLELAGTTWWVDRSSFRFLRHALGLREAVLREAALREAAPREALLEADGQDDGGKREQDGGHDRDAVEVALDDRRAGRRRSEAATKHLRETPAPPAVQQDQHDQGA
jgi:hypothetical protein